MTEVSMGGLTILGKLALVICKLTKASGAVVTTKFSVIFWAKISLKLEKAYKPLVLNLDNYPGSS